jgi:enoyl-CoA hydratase/carnithine racemase
MGPEPDPPAPSGPSPAREGTVAGPSLVRVERQGPVAIVYLSHPPLNILSTALLGDLAAALADVLEEGGTRAVVLTGLGQRAFSGGADIREMAPLSQEEARLHSLKGQAATNLIEWMPLPVIAAVHGACLGGGSELVEACDLVLASEEAVFGQPEINLGVIPGWGGTQRLTRLLGPAQAREWVLTGGRKTAREAHEAGLVTRLVPLDGLLDSAVSLARSLASRPPLALAAAKYAVNHAGDPARLEGLEYERELWGLLFETEGQREGMRAFLEKREPRLQPPAQGDLFGSPLFPWARPGSPLERALAIARIDLKGDASAGHRLLARWGEYYRAGAGLGGGPLPGRRRPSGQGPHRGSP